MLDSISYCEECGGKEHLGKCNKDKRRKRQVIQNDMKRRAKISKLRAPRVAEELQLQGYNAHVAYSSHGDFAYVKIYCWE